MKNPLNRDIVPKVYRLKLTPNLEEFTFEGVVEIDYEVGTETREITLNSIDLEIQEAVVAGEKVETISFDKDLERVTFTLKNSVKVDGTMVIRFTGILNDKMKGFYRSAYEVDGKKKFMATTQFEATDARRSFPCWDDPSFKAFFEITLVVPQTFVAISNNHEFSSHTDTKTGLKTVKFERTPLMSTYLVAFCVGEYDYIEDYASNGVRIRVYTELGRSSLGEFALDVAKKVLPWYEEFFNKPYAMKKLDMIAIPDFAAGAMENWGLVTYRSTALLISEDSTLTQKQWVSLVVAHELAHMWFGNLVTMKTWQYLWLNESFATLMEYLAVDQFFPEWNMFDQFVELDFSRAQELDSLKNSHPVEVPLESEKQVDEIFDAISYQKGCSIMRMLQNFVGLDAFREALREYMKTHQWTNTVTEDLWEKLSNATNKDIPAIMSNWVRTTGYPVVSVTKKSDTTYFLRQERFYASGPEQDEQTWHIPIKYVTQEDPLNPKLFLMTKREEILEVGTSGWIKLNAGQVGLYRVKYQEIDALIQAIEKKELSPIDRFGVQSDFSSLAIAGYLDAGAAMKLFSAFNNEDSYVVLKGLSSGLGSMFNVIKDNEVLKPKFEVFAQALFKKEAERLGWSKKDGESSMDSLARVLALSALSKYQEKETVDVARAKFTEYEKVDADLKSLVFATAVRHGGANEFKKVMDIYQKAELNEMKVRALGSLGRTTDETLFKELLSKEFLLETVRAQDLFYVLRGMSDNPLLIKLWWPYYKENIKDISERVGSGFLTARLLTLSTGEFNSLDRLKEVEAFFEENKELLSSIERSQKQALETISINIKIKERCFKGIQSFLEEQ